MAGSGLPRPDRRELVVAGAEFALDAAEHVIDQASRPESVLAGLPWTTKIVLFPVRFLFTAETGDENTNQAAVTHYLTHDAAGAALGRPHSIGVPPALTAELACAPTCCRATGTSSTTISSVPTAGLPELALRASPRWLMVSTTSRGWKTSARSYANVNTLLEVWDPGRLPKTNPHWDRIPALHTKALPHPHRRALSDPSRGCLRETVRPCGSCGRLARDLDLVHV